MSKTTKTQKTLILIGLCFMSIGTGLLPYDYWFVDYFAGMLLGLAIMWGVWKW